jgi:hypothetical protein
MGLKNGGENFFDRMARSGSVRDAFAQNSFGAPADASSKESKGGALAFFPGCGGQERMASGLAQEPEF